MRVHRTGARGGHGGEMVCALCADQETPGGAAGAVLALLHNLPDGPPTPCLKLLGV